MGRWLWGTPTRRGLFRLWLVGALPWSAWWLFLGAPDTLFNVGGDPNILLYVRSCIDRGYECDVVIALPILGSALWLALYLFVRLVLALGRWVMSGFKAPAVDR